MSQPTSATPADDVNAPDVSIFRRELRALREPFRLLKHARSLWRAPKGSRTVMVIPGYTTNDLVMAPLRRYLRSRGHHVRGWGLGLNRGNVDANLTGFVAQVEALVSDTGGNPVTLVGWSLGGVFARETARTRPELVAELITLATPTRQYTRAAQDPSAPLITQPVTAFCSTRDSVVGNVECVDQRNPSVETIEVDSSHLGITLDPTVWLRIAHQLAGHRPG